MLIIVFLRNGILILFMYFYIFQLSTISIYIFTTTSFYYIFNFRVGKSFLRPNNLPVTANKFFTMVNKSFQSEKQQC